MVSGIRTSRPESVDPSESARKLTTITALWCAAMAFIGISFATATYIVTPGVENVPVFVNTENQRVESKWEYLFLIPFFQVFIVFMFAWPLVRWKKNWTKSIDRERYVREKLHSVGMELLTDTPTATKAACIGGWFFSVVLLIGTLYRCGVVMFGTNVLNPY
jgi:hypothetical protein